MLEENPQKYKSQIDQLKEKLNNFDKDKLKRTVIKGLPCNFVPHRTGGSEFAKNGQINIRKQVWNMVTSLDSLKKSCVDKFNSSSQKDPTDPEVKTGEELYQLLKSKQNNSDQFTTNLR